MFLLPVGLYPVAINLFECMKMHGLTNPKFIDPADRQRAAMVCLDSVGRSVGRMVFQAACRHAPPYAA
jgi:hypothetical protein